MKNYIENFLDHGGKIVGFTDQGNPKLAIKVSGGTLEFQLRGLNDEDRRLWQDFYLVQELEAIINEPLEGESSQNL